MDWLSGERKIQGVFGSFGLYGKEKLGVFERETVNNLKREWNCLKVEVEMFEKEL